MSCRPWGGFCVLFVILHWCLVLLNLCPALYWIHGGRRTTTVQVLFTQVKRWYQKDQTEKNKTEEDTKHHLVFWKTIKNQGFKLYFQCLSFRAMLLASFTTGSFYSKIHELFQCLNSPRMLCQLYKLLLLDWYPEILLGLYKERKIQTLKFLECSFRHHLHLINRLHKCNVNNSGLPQESCSEAGSL